MLSSGVRAPAPCGGLAIAVVTRGAGLCARKSEVRGLGLTVLLWGGVFVKGS